MANNGIRGIRQSIPSGYMIGRQSPGSSKGAPGLIPLPPLNQQPVIAGSGGKATQGGGQGGGGTSSAAIVTIAAGTGINVTGAPAYTVSLQVPVTVADGGTNATSASGTALDNITGFSATGYLKRTGAGTYTFVSSIPNTDLANSSITLNSHAVSLGGSLTLTLADISADPLAVAHGGTGAASASGTALDNITGFSSTGILKRTGAGTYIFIADGQLPATATNDNATAGHLGEFVSSGNLSAAQTTATANNLGSISLTAGDWEVDGAILYAASGANLTDAYACVSTTTLDVAQSDMSIAPWQRTILSTAASTLSAHPARLRLSLNSTIPVYLVAFCVFATGTVTAKGIITARRVR